MGFPVWEQGVNETLFQDISPPPMCKKGGAIMRIGCNDDGFPDKPTPYPPMQNGETPPEAEENWGESTEPPTKADLRRAKTKIPRRSHKGSHFADMSHKLNGFMRAYKNTKECAQWTVKELQEFQAKMMILRLPELDEVYQDTKDRRKLRGDAEAHGERWERLSKLSKKLGGAYEAMHRDGHCHEAVMWFVHHVSEPVRKALEEKLTIPLLPYDKHNCPHDFPDQEQKSLCDEYLHQVSCQDCHADNAAPGASSPWAEIVV